MTWCIFITIGSLPQPFRNEPDCLGKRTSGTPTSTAALPGVQLWSARTRQRPPPRHSGEAAAYEVQRSADLHHPVVRVLGPAVLDVEEGGSDCARDRAAVAVGHLDL